MSTRNKGLLWGLAGISAIAATRAIVRRIRRYDLYGKVVLITGASRGLGLVIARQLAQEEGVMLAICARDAEELDIARRELESMSARVFAVPCDITDRQQVQAMIAAVRNHYGTIDVLINNAGIIQGGPMETMNIEDYEEAMKTHFWGPLYTALAVIPHMRQRRQGRIANISSIGGKVPMPHLLPYVASKFALTGLSEGMRAEMRKDNVWVTTVCPGLMRTGSARNAIVKGQHEKEYAWFKIADSLPILTASAEYAARSIIEAIKNGDAELIITLPAKLGARFHGLFPGLSTDLFALVNYLLPSPGGIGSTSAKKGSESQSAASSSVLTEPTDKAAVRNNEI